MERFESLYCGWTALNLSDISLSAISEVFSEEKEQTFTNSCETTIVQDERLLVSRKIRNLDPWFCRKVLSGKRPSFDLAFPRRSPSYRILRQPLHMVEDHTLSKRWSLDHHPGIDYRIMIYIIHIYVFFDIIIWFLKYKSYFSSNCYGGATDRDTRPYVSYWFMKYFLMKHWQNKQNRLFFVKKYAPQGRQNHRMQQQICKKCKKNLFFWPKNPLLRDSKKPFIEILDFLPPARGCHAIRRINCACP